MLQCTNENGADSISAVAKAVAKSPFSFNPLTALLACGIPQENAEKLAKKYKVHGDGKEENPQI